MRNSLKVILLIIIPPLFAGCVNLKQAGRDLADGAMQAAESKVVELRGEQFQKGLAGAMNAGFKETEFDPNLDGVQDWDEFLSFQRKAQSFIIADATAGFAAGKSVEEVKARAVTLEESFGLSSGIAALLTLALNLYRNRTRKKALGTAGKKPTLPDESGSLTAE